MTRRSVILFTGYAHVHFACFRPIYERIRDLPGVTVHLSGGLRTKTPEGPVYDLAGLYEPFGIDPDHLLPVEELDALDVDFLFAANTKMIAPRTAHHRVQIFHGISFRNKAVRPENSGADQYFIVGPYMRRAFERTGILPPDDPRALSIGFCKTDRLLNGALDRDEILRAHGLAGDRPVLLYAPTGQKHNSLETMGEEVIARLAQTGKHDLIIKPHDHPKNPIDWRSRLAPLEGGHTRISHEPDVIRLLFVADLLITDASSVSSEYALLDRPMVFLDVPKLLRRAAKAADAMVDTETWGRRCGRIVRQPDEIERIVAESLDDPAIGSDVRRAMAQDLFYNPGTATDAAMESLTERLSKPDQTINASSGTAATPAGENREAAIEEAFGGKNE